MSTVATVITISQTLCPACKGAVENEGEKYLWWCSACQIWWGYTLRPLPDRRQGRPDNRPLPRLERRVLDFAPKTEAV